MPGSIRDNPQRGRFELDLEGETVGNTAFVAYRLSPGVITLTHSEVPRALRGHGAGTRLARAVFTHLRGRGLGVVPACGFLAAFVATHPEFADLLSAKPTAGEAKAEHAHLDALLDEGLEATFPASDPVAIGKTDRL